MQLVPLLFGSLEQETEKKRLVALQKYLQNEHSFPRLLRLLPLRIIEPLRLGYSFSENVYVIFYSEENEIVLLRSFVRSR